MQLGQAYVDAPPACSMCRRSSQILPQFMALLPSVLCVCFERDDLEVLLKSAPCFLGFADSLFVVLASPDRLRLLASICHRILCQRYPFGLQRFIRDPQTPKKGTRPSERLKPQAAPRRKEVASRWMISSVFRVICLGFRAQGSGFRRMQLVRQLAAHPTSCS